MPFLTGLTFHLLGFPEQRQQELSDWITEAEGDLAYSDHQGKVDYLLVPMTGWDGDLMPHRHLVSDAWLESCLDYDNGTGRNNGGGDYWLLRLSHHVLQTLRTQVSNHPLALIHISLVFW